MTDLIEATQISAPPVTGKSWAVKIIEGDRQGASAYYPKEVLEAGAPLFKSGTKVYWNHPTLTEMEERPVRDAREILGHFTEDAAFDGKDLNGKIHVLESQRPRVKELAEAGLIGLSIRAEGRLQESAKGSDRVLAEFTKVHSVDVVTEAGAGGKFTQVLESGVGSENAASKSVAESHKEEESMELPKEFLEALDALVQTGKDTAIGVQSLVAAEEAKKTAAAKAEDKKDGGADDDEEDKDGKKKPAFLKAKESISLADLDDKLTEAGLSASGRKAVLAVYENGGDAIAAIESEKGRDSEIRESLGKGFRGAASEDLNESAPDLSALMFGKN
jgi:hypothetical protein